MTVNRSFSELLSFTRGSAATRVNASGAVELVTTNAPRIDYDPVTLAAKGLLIEEQRTNSIRNNTMVGAVVGTPGTLPTNWSTSLAGGLSREIVGTPVVQGVQCIDLRIYGTTTNTSLALNLAFEVSGNIAAAVGQVWTESVWVQMVGGSVSGLGSIILAQTERSAAVSDLAYLQGPSFSGSIGSFTRRTYSPSLSNASTASVGPGLWVNHNGVGSVVDITLRIGLPQLEQGAFATSPILTSGAAATRAADACFVGGDVFSRLFSQEAGTLYVHATNGVQAPLSVDPSFGLASTTDFANASFNGYGISLAHGVSSNLNRISVTARARNATVSKNDVLSIGPLAFLNAGQQIKAALAWDSNTLAASQGGQAAVTTPNTQSATMQTQNRLFVGDQRVGGAPGYTLNGHIRAIRYYPRRLSNEELQALTT
jgi:hypothetical protein